jgi:hypothetical protein
MENRSLIEGVIFIILFILTIGLIGGYNGFREHPLTALIIAGIMIIISVGLHKIINKKKI